MSNNGSWIVRLGAEPETIKLGEREGRKLRVVCSTFGKNSEDRWFNAIVTGKDVETADRLEKGNTIALAGQMVKESYKPKKPRYKGEVVYVDTMPFAKIMEVIKSESFFGGSKEEAAADGVETTEAPALTDDAGTEPTDDLPF